MFKINFVSCNIDFGKEHKQIQQHNCYIWQLASNKIMYTLKGNHMLAHTPIQKKYKSIKIVYPQKCHMAEQLSDGTY